MNIVEEMAKWKEQQARERAAVCPYCNHVHSMDSPTSDMESFPITYWGEGDKSVVEFTCEECERDFWVQEQLTRTFKSTKEKPTLFG
jgi:uncharacterized protein with PIN domain